MMYLVLDRPVKEPLPAFVTFGEGMGDVGGGLHLPHWSLRPCEHWLITGRPKFLDSLRTLFSVRERSRATWSSGTVVRICGRDDVARAARWSSGWRRWFRLPRHRRAEQTAARWFAGIEGLRREDLYPVVAVAEALANSPDLLVLDRLVEELPAALRFHLGLTLKAHADVHGQTIVTLSASDIEGWPAVEHRAEIVGGRLEVIR